MEFRSLVKLYEEGFPENERKPIALLRPMLANERYHFLFATERERSIGFAIVCELSGGAAALLEYIAVAPNSRGRGLGQRMFLAAAKAVCALLIEVESDRAEGSDRFWRMRRKRFYRSLGARELQSLSWIMPPVMATPPPPMEMMVLATGANTIALDQLRQWLVSIYVDVYGRSRNDRRLDTMLSVLPDEVQLV